MQVVGYSISRTRGKTMYWNWLGVASTHRRQGVAESLLTKLLERASEAQENIVELATRNRFSTALIFYISQGFQIVGTYINHDGDLMIKLMLRIA